MDEAVYLQRYRALRALHDERIGELARTTQQLFLELTRDDTAATLRGDPVSAQHVAAHVLESVLSCLHSEKEQQVVKPLLDTYCYNCNNASTWHLCKETEWVTFFDIRTIPFINEHFLICERCNDVLDLDKKAGKKVEKLSPLSVKKSAQLHDNIVERMEAYQLSNKTERQLEYIKSMRSKESE